MRIVCVCVCTTTTDAAAAIDIVRSVRIFGRAHSGDMQHIVRPPHIDTLHCVLLLLLLLLSLTWLTAGYDPTVARLSVSHRLCITQKKTLHNSTKPSTVVL